MCVFCILLRKRRKLEIDHVTAVTAKASEMGNEWAHVIGRVLPPELDLLFASNLVPDLRKIEDMRRIVKPNLSSHRWTYNRL